MKPTHKLSICALIALSSPAFAATFFTGTGDFNDAGNWDSGLPTDANGPGVVQGTATMSANYLMANNGSPSVTDIIVDGGTLNTSTFELQLRSGAVARTSDLYVGNNGTLNVNSGGLIDMAGAAVYLFVGSTANVGGFDISGAGTVNFFSGSTYSVQKGFSVLDGTVNFETGSSFTGAQDFVVVGADGILQFSGLTGGNATTVTVSAGTNVDFQAGSTLDLSFSGAAQGETYTLVSGIGVSYNNFTNVNVSGLDPGLAAQLNYNADSITVDIIPEPSSASLLGLAGLALIMRRRK
ncbi:PEP-CTERM protein-sorting domain-containing protein [Rubritalea squalenifaciens DSM 18772]|uniref:PEP-CTERM protein-sorting domain-containing protein n=1 Tax=Rubritalea squalenifaciens DSM 18772 TaxID=1123071 RepID=A0A1M6AX37_9BACT|nr:PEP-CTERM sorting domain-containing protein [Rubritalea squalenifaciens]SHI41046.1 PEP-CTERM protein-sorting domain-containing protein [Rubritalea squalenifaciens DSM 18772]